MLTNNTRGLWRGKLKYDTKPYKKGEWIEGHFTRLDDNNTAIIPHIYGYGEVEVIADTLGECTGLRDKNGKLIFEGDIVRFTDELGVVRFGEYTTIDGGGSHVGFYVEWRGKADGLCRNDLGYLCEIIEVVGNIYDNPELLEGADEP